MRKLMGLGVMLMAMDQVAYAGSEYVDRARVLSVTPQVERINQPRQECHAEYVRERIYEPASRSNTGSVIGGVTGGLLGSTIGRGSGRVVAAAVGAGIGAIVGDRVGNQPVAGSERVVTRPVEQCVTVDQWQSVTTGYLVNYEYQGRQYTTLMDRDPGSTMDVSVVVTPSYMPAPPVTYHPAAYRAPSEPMYRQTRDRHHYW